jgi:PAS domain S-box-containing protein
MEESTKLLRQHNDSRKKEISKRNQAQEDLRKLNRELMAISRCNQVLVRAVDEQALLNDVCRIVCEEAGYRLAWVGYVVHDEAKTVRPVAQYGYNLGYAADANITWDENSERGQGATGQAIRSGETVYSQNFVLDAKSKPWAEEAVKRGFNSSVALPMKDNDGAVFGALMLYSSEADILTNDELRLLEALAADLAYGIVSLRMRKEHQLAIEALKTSEAHYHSLFERVEDGIYRSTRTGRFEDINPAMVRMFGYSSKEEMMGVDIAADLYFSPEERESTVLPSDRFQTEVFRMRRKDGSEIWVEDSGHYELDEKNHTIIHEGILRDITERIKSEAELIKAKEQAELSDRLKTVFLQNISHEIRTPMNAIKGFSQLLQESGLSNEDLQSFAEIIRMNIDHLLTILTDIITISSLQTKQINVEEQLANINDIVDEKTFLFRNELKEKNCNLLLEKGLSNERTFLYTDVHKVSEALNHLISNALKFTTNGTITLGYTVKDDLLEFYVCDTGIGIEPDMLERIFDPFRKVNNEPIENIRGTGLGLSISKEYANLMGGAMHVVSELGKGSCFYFTIPYRPVH